MRIALSLVVSVAVFASAFSANAFADPKVLRDAKAFIEKTLRDPTGVLYRNIKVTAGVGVCGELNPKNEYGGYSGFEDFAYLEKGGRLWSGSAGAGSEKLIQRALVFEKLGCDAGLSVYATPAFIDAINKGRAAKGQPPVDTSFID